MSCCGNCEMCRPRMIGCSAGVGSVIVLYAASEDIVEKIAKENPGKTILIRDWSSAPEDIKKEALKEISLKLHYEQKQWELEKAAREEKVHSQGRDQWKHRQKFHSR